jgi:hypothetical protein
VPLFGSSWLPPPVNPATVGNVMYATPTAGLLAEESMLKLPASAGL